MTDAFAMTCSASVFARSTVMGARMRKVFAARSPTAIRRSTAKSSSRTWSDSAKSDTKRNARAVTGCANGKKRRPVSDWPDVLNTISRVTSGRNADPSSEISTPSRPAPFQRRGWTNRHEKPPTVTDAGNVIKTSFPLLVIRAPASVMCHVSAGGTG